MRLKPLLLRLLPVHALAVCGAILADSTFASPAFCGLSAGCDAVIFSAFGRPLGIPLPVVGVAAFGIFLLLSLFPGRRRFVLLGPMALLAGVIGLVLILVQILVLNQICPLCLLVDACGLGLAAVELGCNRPQTDLPIPSWPRRCAWLTAGTVALSAPPLWALLRPPPPVPEEVKTQWIPDQVTIVEVTDFDCKYCRQAQPLVTAFVLEQSNHVRLVRLVAPLPRHVNARPAGRAYLAADLQGQGEAMATALFTSDDLTAGGCRSLAESLGLDMDTYDRALSDPATEVTLDTTNAWVEAAGSRGLPLIWVQDQLLVGVPTSEALHAALGRVERRQAERK